jgi:hypothetical protein
MLVRHRLGDTVLEVATDTGQPLSVDVDAAVDHRPRNRDVNGLCVPGQQTVSAPWVEAMEAARETMASGRSPVAAQV